MPESAEDRARIDESRIRQTELFDTWTLRLAAGALPLSMIFFREVAGHPSPLSRWFLLLAWVLLGGALLNVLWSWLVSEREARLFLDRDDRGEEHDWDSERRQERQNRRSLALFASGVIAFGTFAGINVMGGITDGKTAPTVAEGRQTEGEDRAGRNDRKTKETQTPADQAAEAEG